MTEEELERVSKHLADQQAAMFSQGTAYNNVITAAGYAGAFALWNAVKGQLSPTASNWVVLSIGISLTSFIGWNVYTMIWLATERMRYLTQLNGLAGDIFIKTYIALEKETKRRYAAYKNIWIYHLVVTIVTGAIGLGVLLVNCAINLLVVE